MAVSPSEGMDYKPRRKGIGGSQPGRDVRSAPPAIKLAAQRWAIAEIGGGVEAVLYRKLEPGGRFSPKQFEPVLMLLDLYFPDEFREYIGGREDRAANIIMQRVHKMYYGTTPTTKGRGEGSNEHPRHWTSNKRREAEVRLDEAGWPW